MDFIETVADPADIPIPPNCQFQNVGRVYNSELGYSLTQNHIGQWVVRIGPVNLGYVTYAGEIAMDWNMVPYAENNSIREHAHKLIEVDANSGQATVLRKDQTCRYDNDNGWMTVAEFVESYRLNTDVFNLSTAIDNFHLA